MLNTANVGSLVDDNSSANEKIVNNGEPDDDPNDDANNESSINDTPIDDMTNGILALVIMVVTTIPTLVVLATVSPRRYRHNLTSSTVILSGFSKSSMIALPLFFNLTQ